MSCSTGIVRSARLIPPTGERKDAGQYPWTRAPAIVSPFTHPNVDTMIAAVEAPSATGLTWCNDTPHRIMAAVATDDGKAVAYGVKDGSELIWKVEPLP